MGYENALEAAGAEVHTFEEFGSYQGDWWAKVTWKGVTGWVHGCYGSCSGCDALEGEFGYDSHECGEDKWHSPIYSGFREGCETCQQIHARFAEFGEGYLEDLLTQEQALAKASENLEWDMDAEDMVKFIKENA